MSGMHPKRELYAALDNWLGEGTMLVPEGREADHILACLWQDDILDDVPRDELRRYVESWLRMNTVPTVKP